MKYSVLLCISSFFVMSYAGRISWGTVYVVNHSPYPIEVIADQTDAWDVVNHRTWFVAPGAIEVMGFLDTLKHIQLKGNFPDIATAPAKLKGVHHVRFKRKKTSDLVLDIGINSRTNEWLIQPRYVGTVKIEGGGKSGYHIITEQP